MRTYFSWDPHTLIIMPHFITVEVFWNTFSLNSSRREKCQSIKNFYFFKSFFSCIISFHIYLFSFYYKISACQNKSQKVSLFKTF